jgi:hypothetical protein
MKRITLTNDRFESIHLQVRIGNHKHAEENQLVFDDFLTLGQTKVFEFEGELFCRNYVSELIITGDKIFGSWEQVFEEKAQVKYVYESTEDLQLLIQEFESLTLPLKNWTHIEHLAVGLWYTYKNISENVSDIVKNNIIKYNDAVGIPNTNSTGYHETLTRFWLLFISEFLKINKNISIIKLFKSLIYADISTKDFPLLFYSKGILFSSDARLDWKLPDLRPISDLTTFANNLILHEEIKDI